MVKKSAGPLVSLGIQKHKTTIFFFYLFQKQIIKCLKIYKIQFANKQHIWRNDIPDKFPNIYFVLVGIFSHGTSSSLVPVPRRPVAWSQPTTANADAPKFKNSLPATVSPGRLCAFPGAGQPSLPIAKRPDRLMTATAGAKRCADIFYRVCRGSHSNFHSNLFTDMRKHYILL